ncbi:MULTISPECIES: SGNH/GDSL hydrolase family protein [Xanthomonas]|uniref:SGNH/GDSL hydrolase family protein n=1 Tax=Xanthomonas rydalmerensis TaxID=3046274 RepID=A0ABZ0JRZ9_9XANT|nr:MULTISPECIES: SGNH/GDSL hydrolase family protein [unclassified Xanthomonas]MBB5876101.1 lysophospholipase L1-like esterase [Xanthomonas sp. 3498]WOS42604.1 SGNH/GDSL hydrolase family protein [Xanthomonas sp. DM-2023]WOS46790.1 SGNH/GDSL hydrolase family protein [Xanthomonas sp. DM-2023]WOS50970.1 SGNH/GDSL hydrolase family protein [Xanthomonas sp. DM-2023]WOS55150.1 SGNH/GDSL hydrolase family protein [Xanthomonas sp. DM-2023]
MKTILLLSCLVAAPFVAHAATSADSGTCLGAVKHELRLAWPQNHTINIVTFGHSVPAGYFVVPAVHSKDAYPQRIADALEQLYPTAVINVITSAVGGENSSQGLSRFVAEGLGHLPRVITIDYGLNDRNLTVAQSRSNLAAMIREARAANACVVLMTPSIDLKGDPPAAKSTLLEQVDMIRKLAKTEGVSLVDSYAAFAAYQGNRQDLMAQSNHPNAKGHQLIADKVVELLK